MTPWRVESYPDYDFYMPERSHGSRWVLVSYDWGVWTHPRGEAETMENAHEFRPEYPMGWYWTGHDKTDPPEGKHNLLPLHGGGPYASEKLAKAAATRWLRGVADA